MLELFNNDDCFWTCIPILAVRQLLIDHFIYADGNYYYGIIKHRDSLEMSILNSIYFQGTVDCLIYSAVSKIISTTITFPYQVLRTRLQVNINIGCF